MRQDISGYTYIESANKLFPTSHRLGTCWTVRGSNRGRLKRFYVFPKVRTCSGDHPASSSTGTGVVYREVKRPEREVNQLFLSNVKVKHDCTRRLLPLDISSCSRRGQIYHSILLFPDHHIMQYFERQVSCLLKEHRE
jgi:hypothetical protein